MSEPPHLDARFRHGDGELTLSVDVSLHESCVAVAETTRAARQAFVDLIAGFLRPAEGWIRIDGEVVVDTERRVWVPPRKRRVGLVPAGGALFPHLSLEENLVFGVRRFGPEVLGRFQSLVQGFGLGRLFGTAVRSLAPKDALFAATVRALMPAPRLLLLEEPAESLDPPHADEELTDLLERIRARETPVLFTARDARGLPEPVRVIRFDPDDEGRGR
jgi:molybdate transport system ATP-binding protein